jgi:hypothetical protein
MASGRGRSLVFAAFSSLRLVVRKRTIWTHRNWFADYRLLKNWSVRWGTGLRTLKLRFGIVQDLRCPLQRFRATICYSAMRRFIIRARFRKFARLRPSGP